ncbi:hypothetical protein CYLTODRAFT_208949 [Cylindrobasidium torrendii FP15055 ss-10]|uniref:Uncharacterized protein n=1 Tax=Cylindrobasidium torrendii FP15055 ss-10 TaxID=1314674 RepID=A0A0D7BHH8_9AGAR|nr:hypothetical protein CYLTODRAFT_208949 [Cylindrobasidium torrendii FP15055 ss-10]
MSTNPINTTTTTTTNLNSDALVHALADLIHTLFSHASAQLETMDQCYAHALRIVNRGRLTRNRVSNLLRSAPEINAQLRIKVYEWLETNANGEEISFRELGFERHPLVGY